jgi:hypothetical protein
MKISKILLFSIVIVGLSTSCEKAYVIPKPKVDTGNGGGGGGTPATVFYATDIQPIFDNKCLGCHNTTVPKLTSGISYASLVPSKVNAGSASTSDLFITLSPGGNMYEDYVQISAAELAKIETWINEGAKDN